jgi:uncharacterized protein YbbK (DUF523 family)
VPVKKTDPPLQIGVSACLLGHRVRYDGNHRYDDHVIKSLTTIFQLIGICPEMEIGLGVPRATIQLQKIDGQIRLVSVTDSDQDYTEAMTSFAKDCLEQQQLSGLVLKDRSPSCGVANTIINNGQNTMGHGLFTQTITTIRPELPIISAEQLQQRGAVDNFIAQVKAFAATCTH